MNKQRIEIFGRVVATPEVKKSKGEKEYAILDVAVNAKSKDKDGNPSEKATFYSALLFGKRASVASRIDKGTPVRVLGDLDVRPYISKNGDARNDLKIMTKEFNIFDTSLYRN